MSNPVAGQDYRVNMTAKTDDSGTRTIVDLTGATVTIEYRKPDNTIVEGVTPTLVGTTGGEIEYLMPKTLTTQGTWFIWAKIINSEGKESYVNPAVNVTFENKGT